MDLDTQIATKNDAGLTPERRSMSAGSVLSWGVVGLMLAAAGFLLGLAFCAQVLQLGRMESGVAAVVSGAAFAAVGGMMLSRMRILDRYVIRAFLLNYFLALLVVTGMYILLDLIVNFQGFSKGANVAHESSATDLLLDMVDYYGYQMLVIFQQVSGIVPTLAAGFTMVRMTRHNELTAMLSSGVSLYRVAAPIVVVSLAFQSLAVLDQETLMPRYQDKLLRKHEEVNRVSNESAPPLYFVQDAYNRVLASAYDKEKKQMKNVRILERDPYGRVLKRSMADTATWDPGAGDGHGGWRLEGNARMIDDQGREAFAGQMAQLEYVTKLQPRHIELVLSKRAVDFLSSMQIQELVKYSPKATKPSLEKIMHQRVTQPLMNIIMLLLGIPFLLTRQPGQLVKNHVYCAVASGVCFAATFVCFQMGGTVISPLLGAWLPVLMFAPVSLAALDSIRT